MTMVMMIAHACGRHCDQPDHATCAVACALALDAFAEGFRGRWREQGVDLGATRIGVHAGPAIVGNFGASRFFDDTAYGDTINTAARLICPAPRSWVEKAYPKLIQYNRHPKGGHFAAWEQPQAITDDLRAGFRSLH